MKPTSLYAHVLLSQHLLTQITVIELLLLIMITIPACCSVSQELIANGDAMRCPKCSQTLTKDSGCDWTVCRCSLEICWATMGPRWGPGVRFHINVWLQRVCCRCYLMCVITAVAFWLIAARLKSVKVDMCWTAILLAVGPSVRRVNEWTPLKYLIELKLLFLTEHQWGAISSRN